MSNEFKSLHLCVFDYRAYIYLSNEVYANKFILCSELITFIRYKNNSYYFIYYTKYTDSYVKEYKLLDKISLEIKLLVSRPSNKNRLTPVPIPYISIFPIQNNSAFYFLLLSLSLSFYLLHLSQYLKSL